MANSTKPGLTAVTTPAATDLISVRQTGDTRDKKETVAQLQGVVLGLSPATAAPQANVDNLQLDGNTLSSIAGGLTLAPFTGFLQIGTGGPGLRVNSGDLESRNAANSGYNSLGASFFFATDGTQYKAKFISTVGFIAASDAQYLISSASNLGGVTTGDTGQKRDSAGVWLDTNGSSGLGARLTGRVVEANTAGVASPNLLTTTESRKLQHNTGVSAENYHTLPAGAPIGWEQDFACQDTDGIRVVAQAGETISVGPGVVSSAGGYVESVVVESLISLVKITATKYISRVIVGTWTAA